MTYETLPDEELAKRAQSNDSAAVNELLHRHKSLVNKAVRRFFLPSGDTDDLVRLAISSDKKSGALHKLATNEIKAEAQADKIEKLLPCLFEEEVAVYKRARNAHYSSSAKNASIGDYKKASGFEALLGYLYLTGKHDRLNELLSIE